MLYFEISTIFCGFFYFPHNIQYETIRFQQRTFRAVADFLPTGDDQGSRFSSVLM